MFVSFLPRSSIWIDQIRPHPFSTQNIFVSKILLLVIIWMLERFLTVLYIVCICFIAIYLKCSSLAKVMFNFRIHIILEITFFIVKTYMHAVWKNLICVVFPHCLINSPVLWGGETRNQLNTALLASACTFARTWVITHVKTQCLTKVILYNFHAYTCNN